MITASRVREQPTTNPFLSKGGSALTSKIIPVQSYQPMVLCVVDDLIFSIKISTTGKALGVELYFERSADQVVSRVREKRPSLVILDLNSAKLRPMEAI